MYRKFRLQIPIEFKHEDFTKNMIPVNIVWGQANIWVVQHSPRRKKWTRRSGAEFGNGLENLKKDEEKLYWEKGKRGKLQ